MVLSFAHLKKGNSSSTPSQKKIDVQERKKKHDVLIHRPQGMGIFKTAFLASVNYCDGCPRFWPADDNDKKHGIMYGRCKRGETEEHEIWKSIPLTATVARCWYHQQEKLDQESYGPCHEDIGIEWTLQLR